MSFSYKLPLGLVLGLGALAGCKKDIDKYHPSPVTGGFATIVLPNTPVLATKYAPGETIPLTLGYNTGDNPTNFTVFQATKTDSAQVGSYPISGTLDGSTGASVQTVPYTVPATYPVGTAVRVDIRVIFADGGVRLRRITYTVGNAPTLANGTTTLTYRNGLGASQQLEGDVIGYAVALNTGGVSTGTGTNLYKAVDSLVYSARAGSNGALQRQGVIKTPTNGAALNRTIDVRIPSGSAAAGGAQFVFTAYAQNTTTTLTSALLPVAGTSTALATTRRGTVSFGAGSSPDSLAFNLVEGLNEPAANAVTAKDLQVSGLSSSGALTLSAPNASRFYKLTSTQLAATPYATATANAVGALSYQNTASADLGAPAVGDVYAGRLRSTGAPVLLRIIGVRGSTGGSVGRVRFEYRGL